VKKQRLLEVIAVGVTVLALALLVNYQGYVMEKQRVELNKIVRNPCGFHFNQPPVPAELRVQEQ
jgi:hypothetical protein